MVFSRHGVERGREGLAFQSPMTFRLLESCKERNRKRAKNGTSFWGGISKVHVAA